MKVASHLRTSCTKEITQECHGWVDVSHRSKVDELTSTHAFNLDAEKNNLRQCICSERKQQNALYNVVSDSRQIKQDACKSVDSVNKEGSSTAIASHERMKIEGELRCGGIYSKCFNSASFYLILHKWMIFLTIFIFLVHSSFIYSRWADRSSTGYGSYGTATGRVQRHHPHTGGYNRLHDHTYHFKTVGEE